MVSVPIPCAAFPAKTRQRLQELGLTTIADFILHLPLRYEDATRLTPIAVLRPGTIVQVEGEILHCDAQYQPRRQLTAVLSDGTGALQLRWLHFYPSQHRQLTAGCRLRAQGEVRYRRGWRGAQDHAGYSGEIPYELIHPRISRAEQPLATTLTPIYPTTKGVTQAVLHKAIEQALIQGDLSETLPFPVRERYALAPFEASIRLLHTPPANVDIQALRAQDHPAWRRIKFDELLAQQLCLAAARAARCAHQALALTRSTQPEGLVDKLYQHLPFTLTAAQTRVINEIATDLAQPFPMHRLLQGDVGSGKTVVAALGAAQAIEAGVQVALMAPTEILAEQHFCKLVEWLRPLGVNIAWLSARIGNKIKREVAAEIAAGKVQLVVGTQALIQDQVAFQCLGLTIVDEQHRFGVGQRLALQRKGCAIPVTCIPHQLSMSATPIPRTLAMTFLADLDVSIIDELPPGRRPITTKLAAQARREEVIANLAKAVRSGRQAYWICPLVEESETLQLQTAVATHTTLQSTLSDLRIGLVHSRLPSTEKAAVMQAFRGGEIDILVATTVVEVGVDVPNASLMVIEHAERFGLAQLHQLRGRIGRGTTESTCVLLYQDPLSRLARERLKAMFETGDGFEIARRDLLHRGPGEFLGTRQSGVTLLRFANVHTDIQLVEQAREAAAWLRQAYPDAVQAHLVRWLRGREDFLRI